MAGMGVAGQLLTQLLTMGCSVAADGPPTVRFLPLLGASCRCWERAGDNL